jgi:four helix bundle protein
MIFNFENLKVYQLGLEFTNSVFEKSKDWSAKYQFNISDQIRRASLSIPLNIAEGSSKSKIEFKRFLSISRGSCYECIPLIEILFKQKLISLKEREIWYNQLLSLSKMLSSLRSSLSN